MPDSPNLSVLAIGKEYFASFVVFYHIVKTNKVVNFVRSKDYGKPNVVKFNKIKIQYSIAKIQHSAIKFDVLLNFPFQKLNCNVQQKFQYTQKKKSD